MKSLYLIRHAEAAQQEAGEKDYGRPLSSRGEADASRMGQRLAQWPSPQIMVASPAVRAKTTATILATAIGFPTKSLVFDERIYEAAIEDLRSAILQVVKDTVTCVMLVGHNPALTQLVNNLGITQVSNMPPCSMASLRFPSDSWEDIDWISAELVEFDYPGKA